jgi:hypothetical protein
MEGIADADTQAPKLSGDVAEGTQQQQRGSEEMEEVIDRTAAPTDTLVRRTKARGDKGEETSGSFASSASQLASQQKERVPVLTMEGKKRFTLEDLMNELRTFIIFDADEFFTRIILQAAEELEIEVTQIDVMAKQYAETRSTTPARKVEEGENDSASAECATSTLPLSKEPRTVLGDINEVISKFLWALEELTWIVEYIKITVDASLEKIKIILDCYRFVRNMSNRLARPTSEFNESLTAKYLIKDMGKSKNTQVHEAFEVHDKATRIANTLLGIAARIYE